MLSLAFLWLVWAIGWLATDGEGGTIIAQMLVGAVRFSVMLLTPALLVLWLALPWLHQRGRAALGWRALGAGGAVWAAICAAAVLAD